MTKRMKASLLAVTCTAALGAVLFMLQNGSVDQDVSQPNTAARDCEPNACPPAACVSGYHPEVAAGACCPSCVPDAKRPAPSDPCARQRCAPCPSGARPETVEGECCPRCVAEDSKACEQGKNLYEDRFEELEAELRGCTADEDCTVSSFGDACRASCPLPLNKRALGSVVSELRSLAAEHCQACAPERFECPRRTSDTARCVRDRCEFALPATSGSPP